MKRHRYALSAHAVALSVFAATALAGAPASASPVPVSSTSSSVPPASVPPASVPPAQGSAPGTAVVPSAVAAPPSSTSFTVALPLTGANLGAVAALTQHSVAAPLSVAARAQALVASAPKAAVAQAVEAFAAAHGLPVVAATHWDVTVRVTPQQARALFGVTLHSVTSALAPGKQFVAPSAPVAVPPALHDLVSAVVGFDTRPVVVPAALHLAAPRPQSGQWSGGGSTPPSGTTPSNSGTYTVSQAAAAYNVSGTGAGETVAIPEFGGYLGSDVATFAAARNLSITPGQIQVQTVDGGAAAFAAGQTEASLDSELVLGQAPLAHQLIINAPDTGSGIIDAYTAIAQDEANGTAIQAVTTSWASPDMTAYQSSATSDAAFFASMASAIQQVVAGGATVFAASGDSGAYANSQQNAPDNQLAVNMPAEMPQVTGTGGTQLPTATGQAETAWTTAAPLASLSSGAWLGSASGGGYSPLFAQPSWQHAAMPAASQRAVPDVSANAGVGIWIYTSTGGDWAPWGGTSAAAPQWAAGLVDALSKGHVTTGLGNINPTLYANANDFNKISSGGNFGFQTQANGGYSMVTGLGSPNWALLGPALVPSLAVAPPAPSGPALSGRIAVARNSGGNAEVFATDTHGNLIHSWACATCAGGWSGWSVLASGGFVGTPSAHLDSTGRMEVVVRTASGQLEVFWQNTPAAGPWDGPSVIGGGATSAPDLIAWPNGRLEVFTTGGGQVLHVWQNAPGVGNWSPELGLGGNPMPATHVTVGMNSAGYAEVFATSTSGQLVHSWFTGGPPGGWSPWQVLQPQAVIGSPSVGQNQDGRLEVFVRTPNGSLYHTWQNAPSAGPWYGADLGGSLTSSPVVTQESSLTGGNLDVFANSGGQVVVQRQEPTTAAYWSGWIPLGGSPSAGVSVGPNGDTMLAAPTPNGPAVSTPVSLGIWSQWQAAS